MVDTEREDDFVVVANIESIEDILISGGGICFSRQSVYLAEISSYRKYLYIRVIYGRSSNNDKRRLSIPTTTTSKAEKFPRQ